MTPELPDPVDRHGDGPDVGSPPTPLYDPDCTLCWLGLPHTAERHRECLEAAERLTGLTPKE